MNLKITHYNNFFKIKGILNQKNVHIFQNAFAHIFETNNAVTISVEGLEGIDKYGIKALAELHEQSVSKQKSLSIIGMGCKELFNFFKSVEKAA
ncbi:hypothetical protein OE09_0355 [Flavobacteriaceae bacterium MAR_2010_72]|nr:hypothetical protein OE09_0355 [Flavobacteriaceae bacterium MAR_2010_72]TVZ57935.1 hypothetical protein NA63_0426 [Flavobacteriaceae bacterium MAR_2010_105]